MLVGLFDCLLVCLIVSLCVLACMFGCRLFLCLRVPLCTSYVLSSLVYCTRVVTMCFVFDVFFLCVCLLV